VKEQLKEHIRKLIKPLKREDELKVILKRKLTKKEFKLLQSWSQNRELSYILESLNIDKKRYSELREKLIKKINQESFKQEIMI
jgi:hypothetical protein